jgi:hypothetical protein
MDTSHDFAVGRHGELNAALSVTHRWSANYLLHIPIDERHRCTNRCAQFIDGQLANATDGLAIGQYEQDGFYLFGCDSEWRCVTDTRHQTLQDAKQQAEFEYEGVSQTWIDVT